MSKRADRLTRVRIAIAAGQTDEEIGIALDILPADAFVLRQDVMKEELDRFAGVTEESFASYAVFMVERMKDLADLYKQLKVGRQGTAAVGAVKGQADLYERVMKKGQELGLLKQADDGKGLRLIGLDDGELAAELHRRLSQVQRLRAQNAGIPFSEVTYPPPAGMKKPATKEKTEAKPRKSKKPGFFKIKRKASLPATRSMR